MYEEISQNKCSDNGGISALIIGRMRELLEFGGGHGVGSSATKNYVRQSIHLSVMAYGVNLLLQR